MEFKVKSIDDEYIIYDTNNEYGVNITVKEDAQIVCNLLNSIFHDTRIMRYELLINNDLIYGIRDTIEFKDYTDYKSICKLLNELDYQNKQ